MIRNQMVTLHALVMIFGAAMPALVSLANRQIPLMIGAPDMALPRMNNWSFWILPLAFAATSWYWHFVDVVWLYLFVFVYWL